MEGLTVFFKQLGKNFEKQPGWVWLFGITYVVLSAFPLQGLVDAMRLQLTAPKFSTEIWATLVTLLLYLSGDALDKVSFNTDKEGQLVRPFSKYIPWLSKRLPGFSTEEIREARTTFEVHDGIYDVSMKILEKAKLADRVHLLNETAKTFRSLILPALAVAVVFSLNFPFPWLLVPIALAVLVALALAFLIYPPLKNLHRKKLYKTAADLHKQQIGKKLIVKPDGKKDGDVLTLFWDGTFVATALRKES
jgi:hypothetical protein